MPISNRKKMALSGALLAAAVLLEGGWLQKYFFEVRRFRIGPRRGGPTLRILLLTDLHFRRRLFPFHRRLARKVRALQPDLILFAGDTLDDDGHAAPVDQFFSLLPRVPLIGIPGNHDRLAAIPLSGLEDLFRKHAGRLLINETVTLTLKEVPLTVTGLDDTIQGVSNLQAAVQDTGREPHHLMLIHSPVQQEEVLSGLEKINRSRPAAAQLAVQYLFAGHNHGGQIRLPFFIPVLPAFGGAYVEGWYNPQPPYLYLSRGFGTTTIPLRFASRSEVTLFEYEA
ncbi:MAG TPA: metallophosphoesterase [Chitinophagaceae bacterium]|jgi:hypothetical protein|nr:metallophosphoesterase [Chitinophagaceae bacterium]